MHRITALAVTALTAALAIAFTSSRAEAGGGCHSNVFTDEAKTAVKLSKNCFSPTVVRVQPGDQVTWTNTDPTAHTVTGVADSWGTDTQIVEGQSLSYKFDKSGVFPYFCFLHPSMVGAVVVGDGQAVSTSSAAGDGVSAVSAVAPGGDANSSAAPVSASADSGDGVAVWLVVAIGAVAAMGGFVTATVLRRKSTGS